MKIIELKPLFVNKYISIPIGILLIFASVYNVFLTDIVTNANLFYFGLGILSIVLSFEKQIFGVLRFLKYSNKKIIYKRTFFTKAQEILISEITEIKFHGSKIYIISLTKTIVISLDFIKMESRLKLRDFFVETFKNKVVFLEQENIFVERYKRKLKKIEEKQKLKNEQ